MNLSFYTIFFACLISTSVFASNTGWIFLNSSQEEDRVIEVRWRNFQLGGTYAAFYDCKSGIEEETGDFYTFECEAILPSWQSCDGATRESDSWMQRNVQRGMGKYVGLTYPRRSEGEYYFKIWNSDTPVGNLYTLHDLHNDYNEDFKDSIISSLAALEYAALSTGLGGLIFKSGTRFIGHAVSKLGKRAVAKYITPFLKGSNFVGSALGGHSGGITVTKRSIDAFWEDISTLRILNKNYLDAKSLFKQSLLVSRKSLDAYKSIAFFGDEAFSTFDELKCYLKRVLFDSPASLVNLNDYRTHHGGYVPTSSSEDFFISTQNIITGHSQDLLHCFEGSIVPLGCDPSISKIPTNQVRQQSNRVQTYFGRGPVED